MNLSGYETPDYVYGTLEVVAGEAQFRFMPSVNLEFSRDFLGQIVTSDPEAEHVAIWGHARFHPRPEDAQTILAPLYQRPANRPPRCIHNGIVASPSTEVPSATCNAVRASPP